MKNIMKIVLLAAPLLSSFAYAYNCGPTTTTAGTCSDIVTGPNLTQENEQKAMDACQHTYEGKPPNVHECVWKQPQGICQAHTETCTLTTPAP